jgi:2-iminoacetate synthase
VDEARIGAALESGRGEDAGKVREILAEALELKGLRLHDVAALAAVSDAGLLEEVFAAARKVKEEIYGRRLVMFAPLYISNLCKNECLYCAFRRSNTDLKRRVLSQEEIAEETRIIITRGTKHPSGLRRSYPGDSFNYIHVSIATDYSVMKARVRSRRP